MTIGTRTVRQVKGQLKQVMFRHLQQLIRDNFRRLPETCKHNKMISKLNSTRICGCPNTETLAGYVCDSNVPDLQNAKTCPFWEPFQEVLVIKSNFRTLMTSGNRGLIAASYPDIAALMWVLDGVDFTEEVAQVEQEAENNE